ncbi:MAG: chorismate synthase, partial [Actinomycetota bacterium]
MIGSPVAHSLSPSMHNAAYGRLGLDWVYVAFHVAEGRAAEALDAMRLLGLAGMSVTMPHKEAVAAAVDSLDPAAAALRSVNTVVPQPDGSLRGHSTDGAGFVASLGATGVSVISHIIQMGPVRSSSGARPLPVDLGAVDADEVRCFDPASSAAMVEEIKACAKEGDSLGGVAEVLAYGVPVGLGSHVHWDRKIDAALAQAIMSIQAVKGVEIGDGFEVAGRRGSVAHDAISWDAE